MIAFRQINAYNYSVTIALTRSLLISSTERSLIQLDITAIDGIPTSILSTKSILSFRSCLK
jgi:hypothetical protein